MKRKIIVDKQHHSFCTQRKTFSKTVRQIQKPVPCYKELKILVYIISLWFDLHFKLYNICIINGKNNLEKIFTKHIFIYGFENDEGLTKSFDLLMLKKWF